MVNGPPDESDEKFQSLEHHDAGSGQCDITVYNKSAVDTKYVGFWFTPYKITGVTHRHGVILFNASLVSYIYHLMCVLLLYQPEKKWRERVLATVCPHRLTIPWPCSINMRVELFFGCMECGVVINSCICGLAGPETVINRVMLLCVEAFCWQMKWYKIANICACYICSRRLDLFIVIKENVVTLFFRDKFDMDSKDGNSEYFTTLILKNSASLLSMLERRIGKLNMLSPSLFSIGVEYVALRLLFSGPPSLDRYCKTLEIPLSVTTTVFRLCDRLYGLYKGRLIQCIRHVYMPQTAFYKVMGTDKDFSKVRVVKSFS